MSEIIKAPGRFTPLKSPSIFLAGSIEMGSAENWQTVVEDELEESDVTILNPRRDDWDSSWEQDKANPQFREQVEWELHAMEQVDFIPMYFDPKTKSPITLLELGLFANTPKKLLVCCPKGFWRRGNVDIVCERYHVHQVQHLHQFLTHIKVICLLLKGKPEYFK